MRRLNAHAHQAMPLPFIEFSHFRRCHQCNRLNESSNKEVEICHFCGKHFCAFFYFDDRLNVTPSDTGAVNASRPSSSDVHGHSHEKQKIYPPIQGLTAFWESEF